MPTCRVLLLTVLTVLPALARGADGSGTGWKPTSAEEHASQQSDRLGTADAPRMTDEMKQSVSLAELERLALQHNPTLAGMAARVQVAQGRHVQTGLYPNPVAGYHAMQIGNLGTAGQQGGFLSQRIITAGKLRLDQDVVDKDIDAAEFRRQAQEQRVLSDVRVRFYDALVAQKRVALSEELARIGDELVSATNTLLESRQGTDNDLLQAEIRADESHILRDNARHEQLEAWRRLTAVVGTPHLLIAPLSGTLTAELPQLDWDSCYAAVLGSNEELHAARAHLARAASVIRRAEREPIPNVDLSVSVLRNTFTDSDVANVQVGVPIPIFDRNQGNLNAAEAAWVAAQKDVERMELALLDRLAVAYRRYANARQQAERYGQRMVPRAKESLQLVTDGYEKGQVEYLTLLTAQQTYVQVNLSYLDSLRELRASTAIIEGQLLTGSLSTGRY